MCKSNTAKDSIPLDDAFSDFSVDALANLRFIAIDISAIDVTISYIDGIFNSLCYFSGCRLKFG